jgi:hypothetical protein
MIYAAFCVSGFSVRLLAEQQAFGRITTSDIVGAVPDATGVVVMNAKVAVTVTVAGDTRKQLSGSDGGFIFNSLPVQTVDATPSSALIRQWFRGRTVRLAALGQNLAKAEFPLA